MYQIGKFDKNRVWQIRMTNRIFHTKKNSLEYIVKMETRRVWCKMTNYIIKNYVTPAKIASGDM
jgi:hypothetical protein